MATLDDDLAKAVTEGFRLAQGSIINQDLILSGTGDVTVTLADGSKKTGPSWTKLIAQAGAAGASAAAAKTSETNAKTSETNANSSKTAAASSASAAKTSETNAKTSETNAKTSETNAKTSETNAANSASSAAASLAAAQLLTSVPYEEAPFPDVWLPLNDDLRLLAGFAPYDKLTISGQVLELATKSATFTRSTKATYIDKSGVLQTADIDEPRFEKEGLLIEGQSTNYFRHSNDPSKWKSVSNVDSTLTLVSAIDGNTKAPTGQYTTTTGKTNMNLLDSRSNVIKLAIGETLSISCRVKLSENLRFRVRVGNGTSYIGGCYYNPQGELIGAIDKVISSAVLGSDGYITIKITYKADVEGAEYFAQFLIYDLSNVNNNIAIGETCSLQMPQVELGPNASSFIITGASPATRAADDCTLQRSGNDNYPGPITFSVEMHCNGETVSDGTANSRRGILAFYPSTTEFGMLMLDSSASNVGKYLFAYGPATFNVFDQRVDDGEVYRIAATFDGNNISALVNGKASRSPTPVTRPEPGLHPSVTERIYLGRGAGSNASGSRMLNGHIRNLRIWHRVLTPNQINGLR